MRNLLHFFGVAKVVLWLVLPANTQATPGALDLSFDPAMGVNGIVHCISVQPDGKVIVGGEFSTVRGAARNGIARLNPDGSVDRSFDPDQGATSYGLNPESGFNTISGIVYSLALQPDGRILIGGSFTNFNGINLNRIARLNANGGLDTSFDPGTGASGTVYSIAVQNDGKVLIAGSFTNFNGQMRNRIARLNSNGSLDNTFEIGTGASGSINTLLLQPDGKVLLGGFFTAINGANRNRIARLNADGSLDPAFDPGSGISGHVASLAAQPDGRIIIGGEFSSVNGTNRSSIARLNPDGSLDISFDPELASDTLGNASVGSVALQANGKVLMGRNFAFVNGVNINCIARLNSDGSLDESFDPGTGPDAGVHCLAVQPDQNVFIGGRFSAVNGVKRAYLARLDENGSLEASFDAGMGSDDLPPDVSVLVLQPDGKVLLGFESFFVAHYEWPNWPTLWRLNSDGSRDSTFDPGSGANWYVRAIAVQFDGKILLGGGFTAFNGATRNRIARLHPDGSLDYSFDPGVGPNSAVMSIALQPDGKVLIGGGFTAISGTNRNDIARLHSDGTLDGTFDPGVVSGGWVSAVVLQPDGRVLLGGSFTNVSGVPRNRIARLNADGSLDTTFAPGNGANDLVRALALQPDGKILIVGKFTLFNGTSRNGIARLNADGSLDASFNPGSGIAIGVFGNGAYCVAPASNGKALLGGDFFSINGINRSKVARLNSDGSVDMTFDPGLGPHGSVASGVTAVRSLVEQSDGRVLIGGIFKSVNRVPRERVARLLGDGPTLVFGPVRDNNDFVAHFKGNPGLAYTLEFRESLITGNWVKLTNVIVPAADEGLGMGVFELREPISPPGQRFYRVVFPAY